MMNVRWAPRTVLRQAKEEIVPTLLEILRALVVMATLEMELIAQVKKCSMKCAKFSFFQD